MSRLKLTGIFLLVLLSIIPCSSGLAQDARLIAKNTFPSVVLLEMQDSYNRPTKMGSGFFVRSDVVATNYHVIDGASFGSAKIVGETTTYRIEGTVGIDKSRDLALLKLTGANGKPLALADISQVEVGQEIFALGNPRGLEGTISPGIISGMNLREVNNENLIQITAPISPGSSGGPIVNIKGEVIGVASASFTNGQNLNFAVPSSYLAILLAGSKTVSGLSNITPPVADKPPTPPREMMIEPAHKWEKYDQSVSVEFLDDMDSVRITREGTLLVWDQIRNRKSKSPMFERLREIDCYERKSRGLRVFAYEGGIRAEGIGPAGPWQASDPKTPFGDRIKMICEVWAKLRR